MRDWSSKLSCNLRGDYSSRKRGSRGLTALEGSRASQREEREILLILLKYGFLYLIHTRWEIGLPIFAPQDCLVSWTPTCLPFQCVREQEETWLPPDTRDSDWESLHSQKPVY